MKFILLTLCSLLGLSTLAQEEMSITHYQRKWQADTVHLPCQLWDSKDMLIVIPDSLCTNGTVTIKKFKWQKMGGYMYNLTFVNHVITKVEITGKGKKRSQNLRVHHLELLAKQPSDGCKVSSVFDTSGRLTGVRMTIKE
jgi:hypothetical protein